MSELVSEIGTTTFKLVGTTGRIVTEGPQVLVEQPDEHQTTADFIAESKEKPRLNELPLDYVHDSHNTATTNRGSCFGETKRPPEREVIQANNNIYTTRDMQHHTPSNLVFGAPTSGSRVLLQKEARENESEFWNEAKCDPLAKAPPRAPQQPRVEEQYWADTLTVKSPPPEGRGCASASAVAVKGAQGAGHRPSHPYYALTQSSPSLKRHSRRCGTYSAW